MRIRSYLTDKDGFVGYYGADSPVVKDVSEYIENISKFINDHPLSKNICLYRMVMDSHSNPFFSKLEEGDVYEDKSFSSSSMVILPQFGNFMIKILAKKGSNVANVNNMSEYEYLIDKGSKLRVIEKHKNGMGITVELL